MQAASVQPVRRVEVLGIPVDAVHMETAVQIADEAVRGGEQPCRILAVNPEKVIALGKGALPMDRFSSCELLIPDGIGVVWAARVLHGAEISRVAGADLMQELCALAARQGYSIYLLGATEAVNAESARILTERYPGLTVAGRHNGFFDGPAEEIIRNINESGANILFVALGSPKQERWIFENSSRLSVRVIQGVGGTLDTITGHVKRAPLAFQRMHLEWFYRLVRDPRRIRRQLALPLFAWKVIAARLKRRSEGVSRP